MRNYIICFFALMLTACGTDKQAVIENVQLKSGYYSGHLDLGETILPLRIEINQNSFTLFNGREEIHCDYNTYGDSIHIKLPVYGTYCSLKQQADKSLIGNWHNTTRGQEYILPMQIQKSERKVYSKRLQHLNKYQLIFSPNTLDIHQAMLLMNTANEQITGSVLTETGDYRFLEGQVIEDSLYFSCFNGTNAYLFTGKIKQDSIVNGKFYSGNHYSEPWKAIEDDHFELADPYSITFLVAGDSSIHFNAYKRDLTPHSFTTDMFQGNPTILAITSTWCPNCIDELKYYAQLHNKYHEEGLNIIPIMFERKNKLDEIDRNFKRITEDLNIPFEFYYGGKANKNITHEMFPMLNEISSYPTSLFLDKKGRVRKIHTGFYGPGTGQYYIDYTQETEALIEHLLNE